MCSGYSGQSGTGIQAFLKDAVTKRRGGTPAAGGGVSTGGASGPSAASAAGTAYVRRKAGVPLLDSIFGVQVNG